MKRILPCKSEKIEDRQQCRSFRMVKSFPVLIKLFPMVKKNRNFRIERRFPRDFLKNTFSPQEKSPFFENHGKTIDTLF